VVIVAIAFGLGHWPQGAMAVLLTGFLGVGLGAIMVFHRSVWPAVIAHGLFDATSFALIPFALELMKKLPAAGGH
jgi:membrane protease YdiL (CAAX protease family)